MELKGLKTLLFSLWMLLGVTLLVHCQDNDDSLGDEETAINAVVNANNIFTEAILQEILKYKSTDSFVVSPFSLANVLTMIRAGATGRTAEELTRGLKLQNVNESLIYEGYSDLIFQLHENTNVVIETGNRMFTAEEYEIKESYRKLLKEKFYTQAEKTDFTQYQQAADNINRFVATATHDKIKKVVEADSIDEDTKLVLVNAIYFKGLWKNQFISERTTKAPFTTLNGRTISVNMMSTQGEYNYRRIPRLDSSVISLPYKGDRFSMIIILPHENKKLSEIEPRLTNSILADLPSKLRRTDVRVKLPKFKLESDINFVEAKILQNLGIRQILSSRAELKGMTEKPGLFVNAVFQKAFIEVNEEGTEAAAATTAILSVKSEVSITDFEVNRPFIAYIFDEITKSVIFVIRKVD